MNTDFLAIPEWFSYENAGAGIAVADLNADGLLDLVVLRTRPLGPLHLDIAAPRETAFAAAAAPYADRQTRAMRARSSNALGRWCWPRTAPSSARV